MGSFCGYFNSKTCQSCRFIEVDYGVQLRQKEDRLRAALASFQGVTILPAVSSNPTGFRNKAKMIVAGTVEAPIVGIEGKEILECPVHHPAVNELIKLMPDFIRRAKLAPYQIVERTGELKALILYYSEGSGEAYLRFVLRSKESLDRIKKHLPALIRGAESLICVSANIQPVPSAVLEGDEEILLTERSHLDHRLGPVSMGLHPRGFVQTNQSVAVRLYETAATWTKDLGIEKVVELFSGQGAFSFFLAPVVKESVGVEINPEAAAQASATAAAQGLTNLRFLCADATQVGTVLRGTDPQLVLVNPPRRGLAAGVELLNEGYPYVIYSSCSLESLEKDLHQLGARYDVLRAQIFDMFPHTDHFETLLLLKLRA